MTGTVDVSVAPFHGAAGAPCEDNQFPWLEKGESMCSLLPPLGRARGAGWSPTEASLSAPTPGAGLPGRRRASDLTHPCRPVDQGSCLLSGGDGPTGRTRVFTTPIPEGGDRARDGRDMPKATQDIGG